VLSISPGFVLVFFFFFLFKFLVYFCVSLCFFVFSGKGLLAIVKATKATVLMGLSAQPKTFTKEVIEELAKNTDSPIIFALYVT